jgi:hypothetical protein
MALHRARCRAHAWSRSRQVIRPDGTVVDSRILRHGGVKLGDVLGWERVTAPPKHKYVHFEGPDAEALKAACRYPFRRYPQRA